MKYAVKSIFISDLHLGSGYTKSEQLLEKLKEYKYDNLFLVGDIFDGYRLKKWKWSTHDNKLIRKILKDVNNGINVVYVTGNHDEFLREYTPINFNGIQIVDEYVHEDILVIHGDQFDSFLKNKKWIYISGSLLYIFLLHLNETLSKIRRIFNLKPSSLSKRIKQSVKDHINTLIMFQTGAARYTKSLGLKKCVVGHTHIPSLENVYNNCGDWVECGSMIIQTYDGELKLIQ